MNSLLETYLEKLFFEDDYIRHITDITSQYFEKDIIIFETHKDIQLGLLRYTDPPIGKIFIFKLPEEKEIAFHTNGMRFPIDIYFFDRNGYLVKRYKNAFPGISYIPSDKPAKYVIEIPVAYPQIA